jgi:carbonic anhydrase
VIGAEEYLHIVDRALDGMVAIVSDLGDDLAGRRPALPGANSPYALLTHCVGVIGFWGDHVVTGGPLERDRDAEFTATGPVDALLARVAPARARLAAVVAGVAEGDPVRGRPSPHYLGTPIGTTAGGALLHLLEELAQHHGQMEVLRDAIVVEAGAAALPSGPPGPTVPRVREPTPDRPQPDRPQPDRRAVPAVFDEVVAAAAAYGDGFSPAGRGAAPARALTVVACMDARLDLFAMLGLAVGDAHLLRNAGGSVTDDTLRSLVISQRLLGTRATILVHHTGCGMTSFADDDLLDGLEGETGIRPPWAPGAFPDPDTDVRASLERIRTCPWLVSPEARGFVFDVVTGRLRDVEA